MVLLRASVLMAGANDYAAAYKEATDTGRPMVVVVGAHWCPACQVMERNVLPEVRQRGLLSQVAFATVNLDHQRDLGTQLTAGGPIPQLVMYCRTATGWNVRRLIGSQSVSQVERFITEGLAIAEQAKQSGTTRSAAPAANTSASGEKRQTGKNASGSPG